MKLNWLDGKGNMSLEQSVTEQATVMLTHKTRNQGIYLTLTLRRLMSYIYGAPILDVSRSHTTMQHSR